MGQHPSDSHPLHVELRSRKPFDGLNDEQFVDLMSTAREEVLAGGDVLIHEGNSGNDFFVLLSGELEVRRHCRAPDGSQELEVGRVFPGQGVGEFALLFGVPRQASVYVVAPSKILRIDGERMEEMLVWSQQFKEELRDSTTLRARMNLVRQARPFRRLPLERVRMALECMQVQEFEAGATVVRQGEEGDRYYLIEFGDAEVWQTDPLTDETARVSVLGPGDGFGEEALLLGGYRNATVTFVTKARLLLLDKNDFDLLMRPHLVTEISAGPARDMAEREAAEWIDCRYDIEYEEAHIPGARHVPLDRLRELCVGLDTSRPYIVYCRSGRRSIAAAFLLRERGFNAYSLTGGVRDWPYALEGRAAHGSSEPSKRNP